MQLWRVKNGTLSGVYAGGSFANRAAFAPDGQTIAVATLDRGIWILRASDRVLLRTLAVPGGMGEFDEWMAAFSSDGQIIASVTNGGALQIWRFSAAILNLNFAE